MRRDVTCSGHTWSITSCPSASGVNVTGLCVDCPTSCPKLICPYQRTFSILSPCMPCQDQVAYYIVSLGTRTVILYPEIIKSTMIVKTAKQSLTMTTNITTNPGTIYCAAFLTSYLLTSVQDIKSKGYQKTSLIVGSVSIIITNLQPETDYSIYCYTEDFKSHIMPIDVVLRNKMNTKTECCQTIVFSSFSTQIPEYDTSKTPRPTEAVYSIALDSTPKVATIPVLITAVEVNCTNLEILDTPTNNTSIEIIPSLIQFQQTDKTYQKSFLIRGKITKNAYYIPPYTCYMIQASDVTDGDPIFKPTDIKYVKILSQYTPPPPPVLQDGKFSDDGRKIALNFDSDTNQADTVLSGGSRIFQCSKIFSFTGAAVSSCLWNTAKQVIITLGNSKSLIGLGDSITLLGNSIKPSPCPGGVICSYSLTTVITVQNPDNPISPQAVLKAPTIISSCSDLKIDPTLSIGSAGRAWKSIIWSVSIVDDNSSIASFITSHLQTNYPTTDSIAVIPKAIFREGDTDYVISLQLTNFLNILSVASVTVKVSSILIVPYVTLNGPCSIYRTQVLNVLSSVTLPSCATDIRPKYKFTWKVYKGITYMPLLVSNSKDPSVFKLSSYALDLTSETYTIQLIVSSPTNACPEVTTKTQLAITPAGVTATIAGGSSVVIGYKKTLTLDASSSLDLNVNYPTEKSVLNYLWTCTQTTPHYGDACPNFDSFILNNTIFSAPVSKLYAGNGTSLVLTVYVSNSAGLSSSASANVNVLFDNIPSVKIDNIKSKYNVGDNVLVSGSIANDVDVGKGKAIWSGDSYVSLNSIKLTNSLTATTLVGLNSFPLAFSTSTLTSGVSYIFTLSASYDLKPDLYSSSQITVNMNTPPTNGIMQINPNNGTALSTSFFFSTYQCKYTNSCNSLNESLTQIYIT